MAIPPFIRKPVEKRLEDYCDYKVSERVRDKLRIGFRVRGNSIIMFEERPLFSDKSIWTESVVAQFRFNLEDGKWSLYWADRNSRWHIYDDVLPNKNFDVLLGEVDHDPTGIFWG